MSQWFEKKHAIFCRGVRYISLFRCVFLTGPCGWNMSISRGERGRTACTDNVFRAFCPFVLEDSGAKRMERPKIWGKVQIQEFEELFVRISSYSPSMIHHVSVVVRATFVRRAMSSRSALAGVPCWFQGTLKLPNKTKLYPLVPFASCVFLRFAGLKAENPATRLHSSADLGPGMGKACHNNAGHVSTWEIPYKRWCIWEPQ